MESTACFMPRAYATRVPLTGEAPPESTTARLLIADDHDLLRSGLKKIVEDLPGVMVVGEAHDGREVVEMCRNLLPDLVLMDVQMPKMDGLEATRRIKNELPRTIVLMVTAHADPDYLFEALRAGAAGYVLKYATEGELVSSVRKVLSGESPLDPDLAANLLRRLANEGKNPEPPERLREKRPTLLQKLTPRETEILRLLAQGNSNPRIARSLHISEGTVKVNIHHVFLKLGVSDRVQAAVRAAELGLLSDDD